MKYEWYAREVD